MRHAGIAKVAASALCFVSAASVAIADDDTNQSPAIGVAVQPIDARWRTAFRADGIPSPRRPAVVIIGVAAGSPAFKAGIKPSNLLEVHHNGKYVQTAQQFLDWIATLEIGEPATVFLWRYQPHETSTKEKFRWTRRRIEIAPITRRQMQRELLRYSYIKIDEEWVRLPEIDLTASADESLGRFEVGHLGIVPKHFNTFRVKQILDEDDMLVLLERRTRDIEFRFHGFSTRGLTDGSILRHPISIAIIDTTSYTTVLEAQRTVLLAVPADVVRSGLSDEELEELELFLEGAKTEDK